MTYSIKQWLRSKAVAGLTGSLMLMASPVLAADDDPLRFTDEVIPFKSTAVRDIPQRPTPPIEIGDGFFKPGKIGNGFTMPGGAVWNPTLLAYGTYRTAIQSSYDGNGNRTSEWANRLDMFANLQLTGTERILVGFRPLDRKGRFTRYTFGPDARNNRFDNQLNGNVSTFFIEGELDQLVPAINPRGTKPLDIGFSLGRQAINIQDGFLINDTLDALALSHNNILVPGTSNMRVAMLWGWENVNRDDNIEDSNAHIFGLFTETDFHHNVVAVDLAYVHSPDGPNGDGIYIGASSRQTIGWLHSRFRVMSSYALDNENAAVSTGTLLFTELSWSPKSTHNVAYVTGFWGIDQFASAARGPANGGPLGRAGLLFAAKGLGTFAPALSNRADDAIGGAIGYQMFFNHYRTQLTTEMGGRMSTRDSGVDAFGVAMGVEQAVGQHVVLLLDAYSATRDGNDPAHGIRGEMTVKF